MTALPFHPKIVHLPMALAALMPLLTLGFLLAWWRGWLPRKAFYAVIALQAVLVGTGYLAMQSGEEDEERVEKVVAKKLIHEHEEAAEAFVYTGGGALVLMLLAGFYPKEKIALIAAMLSLATTFAVLMMGIRTGDAGGALVYRHGAASAYAGPARAPTRGGEHDKDKDHD